MKLSSPTHSATGTSQGWMEGRADNASHRLIRGLNIGKLRLNKLNAPTLQRSPRARIKWYLDFDHVINIFSSLIIRMHERLVPWFNIRCILMEIRKIAPLFCSRELLCFGDGIPVASATKGRGWDLKISDAFFQNSLLCHFPYIGRAALILLSPRRDTGYDVCNCVWYKAPG